MGTSARIVFLILFIMSGWSIGVVIDRWVAFSTARKQSRAVPPALADALRDGKIDDAIAVAELNKENHLANVVTAGLREFKLHQDGPGEIPGETIEASKRAVERTETTVRNDLKRRLRSLATIGSIAPFIGLLGMVVDVVKAFHNISDQKGFGGAIAGGVAEALVTVASGLLVAGLAVLTFNYLTRWVDAFGAEMESSSTELIGYLLKKRGMRRV